MVFKLRIVVSVLSLSAVFTQPTVKNVHIDIEGLGKGEFEPSYAAPMMEIADLIRAREYDQAIERLLKGSTGFYHKHSWLRGLCYWETGNFPIEKVIYELEQGISKDWSNKSIIDIIWLEVLLSAGKHEKQAQKRIEKMCSSDLIKLGARLCSKRKFDQALRCYSEAFLRFENTPVSPRQCYISRGNCYTKMEKFELSLANFKQAKACNSSSSELRGTDDGAVQVLFIGALFDAGFLDKAIERMNLLKCEEDVVLAIEGISNKNKNFDEALQIISQALKKYPKNANLYEKRGHNYLKMKKFDEAIKDLQKSTELEPSLKKSWINLITVLVITGDYAQAEQVLEDFDTRAVPMTNQELGEFERIRLKIQKAKREEKMNDETEE